jgi:hypothetical protein
MGFRHEVGSDWHAYLNILSFAFDYDLKDIIFSREPGYHFLNWFGANVFGGIYFVNFICAAILLIGLFGFAKKQPIPLIVILVAFPYLILVVGMGYTRQAAAMGFILMAFARFDQKSTIEYLLYIFISSLFHASAILMLPLFVLRLKSIKFFLISGVLLFLPLVFMLGLYYFEAYLNIYVYSKTYSSAGTLPRLILCSIPAVLYLIFCRKLQLSVAAKRLWLVLSVVSILLFILHLVLPALSTPIDRVAIYLIPLQLVVYSHLPLILRSYNISPSLTTLAISFLYLIVLLAWVFFSHYAEYWSPYQFYPLVLLFG